MSKLLIAKNLHASTADKELLHGIDLRIDKGETVVVVGPNGVGKSTLARSLMGVSDFDYSGSISFAGKDVAKLPCEERAKLGMFLSYQDPVAIPGLPVGEMLRSTIEAHGKKVRLREFKLTLAKYLEKLDLNPFSGERELNVDFSGGEKKKLEILQMFVIREYQDETNCSLAIVTHNMRILQSLNVDRVYVIRDGLISCVGDVGMLEDIRKHGFKNA